jgi:hypothetical protein
LAAFGKMVDFSVDEKDFNMVEFKTHRFIDFLNRRSMSFGICRDISSDLMWANGANWGESSEIISCP